VRQKLLNLAAKSGDDPNLLWNRYAIERLLYRLSISEFKERFVLKGAVLFSVWSGAPHRPTMDLDLEGPVLLDMPPPIIRIYPMATVVAEKLHAIVTLGIANSRMKDFYDLYILMRDKEFEYTTLSVAIKGTFDRRKTPLPFDVPFALSDAFARDTQKRTQWAAFMRKINGGISLVELGVVIIALRQFACPVLGIGEGKQNLKFWPPNGPWQGTI